MGEGVIESHMYPEGNRKNGGDPSTLARDQHLSSQCSLDRGLEQQHPVTDLPLCPLLEHLSNSKANQQGQHPGEAVEACRANG